MHICLSFEVQSNCLMPRISVNVLTPDKAGHINQWDSLTFTFCQGDAFSSETHLLLKPRAAIDIT